MNGINIPSPTPVGEGRYFRYFDSKMVITTPSTTAITSAPRQYLGSALNPFERISAKPAHFTLIGEVSGASPELANAASIPYRSAPIPYVRLSSGYMIPTAAPPTGVAISCIQVRYRLFEPMIFPAL